MSGSRHVYPAEWQDIYRLLGRIREVDAKEIYAMTGEDADTALLRTWQRSELTWTIQVHGQVLAAFGIAVPGLLRAVGVPWLVAAPELERYPLGLAKWSVRYVRGMLKVVPHLVNYVDVRNTLAIKWLSWLGFTIHPAEPFGFLGLPFHRFELFEEARACA